MSKEVYSPNGYSGKSMGKPMHIPVKPKANISTSHKAVKQSEHELIANNGMSLMGNGKAGEKNITMPIGHPADLKNAHNFARSNKSSRLQGTTNDQGGN